MGNTYYNSDYKYISSRGGNLNSIGIESACNYGSDLWMTYHITAQLVARLLDKHNLDISRVQGHHTFSGKDCPQTLLEGKGELWYKFMDLVEAELALYKNMSDYTITCKSSNPELVSDNGRVLKVPNYTETVTYTLTIKNNKTGVTKEIKLSSVIHGQYTL
jgi:N-acetylmuramoyl-L-alanine amidase CwlA